MNPRSLFAVPERWMGDGPSSMKPPQPAADGTPGAGEHPFRVLMVDDEELIRRLAMGMARRLRVDLVAVATASAAMEMARASRIDVLVSDVLLGKGEDGIELASQVLALQPWASVVLMSGYSAAHFDLRGLPEHTQFLTKPFSSDSLMHCLTAARQRAASSGQ
jgi:DNA-binding NtrC family response regulator